MEKLGFLLLTVGFSILEANVMSECMIDLPPEGILRNNMYQESNCSWHIVAPQYHVIQFSILRIRFIGNSSRLQIFDGKERTSRLLLDLPEPGKKYWIRSQPDALVNLGVRSAELVVSQVVGSRPFEFTADYFPIRSDSCPFTNESQFCQWENVNWETQKWKLQQVLGSLAAVVETPSGEMAPVRTLLSSQRSFGFATCLSFRFCQTFEQQELRILGIPKENKSSLLLRKNQAYGPKWLPVAVTIPAEHNVGIEVFAASSGNTHSLMKFLTAITGLNIARGECPTASEEPDCDFNLGFCSWTQDGDDCYNWQLNLDNDKISQDKPGRHEWFISVELKQLGTPGCSARLLSMIFPGGESACVRFCFVVKSGVLSVKVLEIATGKETVFLQKQRGLWEWAEVSVWSDTDYKVVFEAEEKTRDWLWIEIDDITIVKDACLNESVTIKSQTSLDVSFQHLRFEYKNQYGTCLSAFVLHRGLCESELSRRVWMECGENKDEWRPVCIGIPEFCPATEAIIQISTTTAMKKQIEIRNPVLEPGYCNRPHDNVSCSFEEDFCSWFQPEGVNGAYWDRTFASKHLPSHGPFTDRTTEEALQPGKSSGYIYCSKGYKNGTAIIYNIIPPSNSVQCLSFWYFMHGNVGGIRIYTRLPPRYLKSQPVWQKYGNQGTQWNKGSVSLKSTGKTRVLFECDQLDSYLNKIIALDDIVVTTGSC